MSAGITLTVHAFIRIPIRSIWYSLPCNAIDLSALMGVEKGAESNEVASLGWLIELLMIAFDIRWRILKAA